MMEVLLILGVVMLFSLASILALPPAFALIAARPKWSPVQLYGSYVDYWLDWAEKRRQE